MPRPVWLVLKNEIITKLTQRSFLMAAFGLPLFSFLIFALAATLNQNSPALIEGVIGEPDAVEAAGYVDEGGLIAGVPDDVPPGILIPFPDEVAAQAALDAGEITLYYLIPADFLTAGEVIEVSPSNNPLTGQRTRARLDWILAVNVAGGDAALADRILHPLEVTEKSLAPATEAPRDKDSPLTFFLPYSLTMIFYFIIFGTASHNISAITVEKESRVIEILLTSVTPRQMFSGKIMGLGIVGLLQAVVWIGSSFLLVRWSGSTFGLSAGLQFPPAIVGWGIIFFMLGYGLYAGFMAGIGALVPNLKEAASAAFAVSSPLLLGLMLMGVTIDDPDGAIALGFSLFPLTAPVFMMTRMAAGASVPLWQILLAIALLLLSIIVTIRLITRLYQAQTLLSGQPFTLKRFVAVLIGQA